MPALTLANLTATPSSAGTVAAKDRDLSAGAGAESAGGQTGAAPSFGQHLRSARHQHASGQRQGERPSDSNSARAAMSTGRPTAAGSGTPTAWTATAARAGGPLAAAMATLEASGLDVSRLSWAARTALQSTAGADVAAADPKAFTSAALAAWVDAPAGNAAADAGDSPLTALVAAIKALASADTKGLDPGIAQMLARVLPAGSSDGAASVDPSSVAAADPADGTRPGMALLAALGQLLGRATAGASATASGTDQLTERSPTVTLPEALQEAEAALTAWTNSAPAATDIGAPDPADLLSRAQKAIAAATAAATAPGLATSDSTTTAVPDPLADAGLPVSTTALDPRADRIARSAVATLAAAVAALSAAGEVTGAETALGKPDGNLPGDTAATREDARAADTGPADPNAALMALLVPTPVTAPAAPAAATTGGGNASTDRPAPLLASGSTPRANPEASPEAGPALLATAGQAVSPGTNAGERPAEPNSPAAEPVRLPADGSLPATAAQASTATPAATPTLPDVTATAGTAQAPTVQAAAAPASTPPNSPATLTEATIEAAIDTAAFAPALGTRIAVLARDGIEQARLNVHPADMGPITVQLSLDGTQVRVDFSAAVAGTRQTLEQAMPSLAASLRDAGFTLSGGGVSQQTSQGNAQAQAGSGDGNGFRSAGTLGGTGAIEAGNATATGARAARTAGLVDLFA